MNEHMILTIIAIALVFITLLLLVIVIALTSGDPEAESQLSLAKQQHEYNKFLEHLHNLKAKEAKQSREWASSSVNNGSAKPMMPVHANSANQHELDNLFSSVNTSGE